VFYDRVMSDLDGPIEGGDSVCWLDQLCPECRAMPSPESPERCWRCGHPLAQEGVRATQTDGRDPGFTQE